MGLYSLYHNLSRHGQIEWLIQSNLTHFLAEGFNSIKCKQSENNPNLFNNICDGFRDKLALMDSNKFLRFGPCLMAVDTIISILCDDNLVG